MTFLEVVFATAMLGIVAGAMFAAYGFALASEAKQQQRLGAAELANRLILNYLDSPSGMPEQNKTIDGGPGGTMKYRWEMLEQPIRVVEAAADQRDHTRDSPLKNDRFRQVSIHVWLSEQSGGSRYPEPNTPSATLTRMLDPIAPRNPDSYMAMIKNPGDIQRMIEIFQGSTPTLAAGPSTGAVSGFERTPGGKSARDTVGTGFKTRAPRQAGGMGLKGTP